MAESPLPTDAWATEPRFASLGHLFTTLWPETSSLPWRQLCLSALERDVLDAVDISLIRTLANLCENGQEKNQEDERNLPLLVILGCLCTKVKSGALRMVARPAPLAEALLEWLVIDLEKNPNESLFDNQTPAALCQDWAQAFLDAAQAGRYARILGDAPEYKPLILHDNALYFQKHYASEASVGNALRRRLHPWENSAITFKDITAPQARAALEDTLQKNPLLHFPRTGDSARTEPLVLAPEQQAAVALALRGRLLVVSGGPGTGKTTLIAALLRTLARAASLDAARSLAGGIRLAAPTGRAAHRLGESLRQSFAALEAAGTATEQDKALAALPCSTLHRLLGYNPVTGRFRHTQANPIDADLVVVDEVSMVDIFMLAKLLEALRPETRLVLVGDRHQLPSVEAGAVLADMLPDTDSDCQSNGQSNSEPATAAHQWLRDCGLAPPASPQSLPNGFSVILSRSHRSTQGILEAAQHINLGNFQGTLAVLAPQFFDTLGGPAGTGKEPSESATQGCRLLLAPDGNFRTHRDQLLAHWTAFHYPDKTGFGACIRRIAALQTDSPALQVELEEAFRGVDQARILTLTRKGPFGCETVNHRIRERFLGSLGNKRARHDNAFPGAPILILENDYQKQLFNGDVGLIIALDGRQCAVFRGPEGFKFFPVTFLPRFELAFATTVHKSQGSEYAHVLLLLPEKDGRLCYREAVYTAVTRAKTFAGIYGTPEVLEKALAREIRRNSGLPSYLSGF